MLRWRNRTTLLLVAAALVVVVAGVSVLAYAVFGPDNTSRAVDSTTAQLRVATAEFVRQPAVRYAGQIKTSVVSSIDVDFTVTHDGTTQGTFIDKETTIALLEVGGKTFYRAPAAYWVAADAIAPKRAARWAKQWVGVLPSRLGIDPRTDLAPAAIVEGLTNVDVTVQVTTAQPFRIVHIKTTKLDLDVSYPREDGPGVFRRLDTQVGLLAQAIDSQVEPGVTGAIVLSPCNQRTCTARATIDALSTLTSHISKPTIADIAVDFTVDGRCWAPARQSWRCHPPARRRPRAQ